MAKRKLVKRNPFARELADPRYQKRVVKSKKLYNRKNTKKGDQMSPFSFSRNMSMSLRNGSNSSILRVLDIR